MCTFSTYCVLLKGVTSVEHIAHDITHSRLVTFKSLEGRLHEEQEISQAGLAIYFH